MWETALLLSIGTTLALYMIDCSNAKKVISLHESESDNEAFRSFENFTMTILKCIGLSAELFVIFFLIICAVGAIAALTFLSPCILICLLLMALK